MCSVYVYMCVEGIPMITRESYIIFYHLVMKRIENFINEGSYTTQCICDFIIIITNTTATTTTTTTTITTTTTTVSKEDQVVGKLSDGLWWNYFKGSGISGIVNLVVVIVMLVVSQVVSIMSDYWLRWW